MVSSRAWGPLPPWDSPSVELRAGGAGARTLEFLDFGEFLCPAARAMGKPGLPLPEAPPFPGSCCLPDFASCGGRGLFLPARLLQKLLALS